MDASTTSGDGALTDAQLLHAVTSGEPDAFDRFVERYGKRLLNFGLRMCGQREDAEDVFQDTLLKAYEGIGRLRDPGALRTWLYRVASNQCLMNRRRVGPKREISLDEFEPEIDRWESAAELDGWSSAPEAEAVRAELQRTLEAAILELPSDYRIVVLLRDVEGLSTRETAEALDIGTAAVKMRLHRARLALRERLADYYREGWKG
jgi:RNA polymerase sigma-70 factor (ECF subfamily)